MAATGSSSPTAPVRPRKWVWEPVYSIGMFPSPAQVRIVVPSPARDGSFDEAGPSTVAEQEHAIAMFDVRAPRLER